MNEPRKASDSDWTGWIIPGGALIIAAGVVLWAIWPRDSGVALAPTPSPSPVASVADPHVVTSASGTFSIRYEAGDLVVRRLDAPVGDLGRVAVPPAVQPAPSGNFTTVNASGSGVYGLVCAADSSGTEVRMVFGYTTNPPLTFTGPPAKATSAPDGMWLFVLDPGPLDPGAQFMIESPPLAGGLPGNSSSQGINSLLDTSANGAKQSSGCWAIGT